MTVSAKLVTVDGQEHTIEFDGSTITVKLGKRKDANAYNTLGKKYDALIKASDDFFNQMATTHCWSEESQTAANKLRPFLGRATVRQQTQHSIPGVPPCGCF